MYRRLLPFLIAACIFLILPFSLSSRVRDLGIRAMSPVSRFFGRQRLGISGFFQTIDQIGVLRQQNASLQQEVVSLEKQVSDYDSLKRENSTLQQELGVTSIPQNLPKLLAQVVVQGNNPLDPTFIIAAGSSNGVKVGQPVIAGGYLVGRIISTTGNSAVVRSIFSSQSIIQAWIPSINDKGLLVGHGNTVNLEDITQGLSVPAQSVVETSGLSGAGETEIPLPQGILIGTTGDSLSKSSALSQTFQVQITEDSSSLQSVMVILTSAP